MQEGSFFQDGLGPERSIAMVNPLHIARNPKADPLCITDYRLGIEGPSGSPFETGVDEEQVWVVDREGWFILMESDRPPVSAYLLL